MTDTRTLETIRARRDELVDRMNAMRRKCGALFTGEIVERIDELNMLLQKLEEPHADRA